MVRAHSLGERLFAWANAVLMIGVALLCLFPFVHMLARSVSSPGAISAGRVGLVPVEFTWRHYQAVLRNPTVWQAFRWSVARSTVGTGLALGLSTLAAYTLAQDSKVFPAHNLVVVILLGAMLFDAGLLAKYIVVRRVGLYDTFWALVVPTAFSPWYTLLLMNFFRGLPEELKEAAQLEGAGHLQVLVDIYLPLARPALATIGLFTAVDLWNEWFLPILYLRSSAMMPLQTYLRGFFSSPWPNARGQQGALALVTILPVILLYPALQRHFEKGLVLGAVK